MDDQEPVDMPIAVFVRRQLDIDQMDFITPVYRDMLNDVVDKVNEEGFSCSKYFLTSPDIRISNLAADMLNDKYRIDKSVNNVEPEINTLAISVPRLVLDFKYFVIKKEMIALKRQLADKQLIADSEKIVQVMRRYKLLSDVQVRLAKQLGDRIIH
jgi:DNA primase